MNLSKADYVVFDLDACDGAQLDRILLAHVSGCREATVNTTHLSVAMNKGCCNTLPMQVTCNGVPAGETFVVVPKVHSDWHCEPMVMYIKYACFLLIYSSSLKSLLFSVSPK